MAFRFEDLKIFQVSVDLANKVDKVVRKFPKVEMFSLSSQLKRATDSVVLNIAEGSGSFSSQKDFSRFLTYALRSCLETVACLYLAFTRQYISEVEYRGFYSDYEALSKMISKLQSKISSVM